MPGRGRVRAPRGREPLGVATEDHVDTTTRHVRRHGYRVQRARLGDDLGLAEVLFRVQDLVGDAGLFQFS